jgi:hypothetical protein
LARRKGPSRRLVLDASVTSSASDRPGLPDPTPRRCRELLDAVLTICHRVVFCPKLREEWRAHRSAYANTWLTSMYARRKVVVLSKPRQSGKLRTAVLSTAEDEVEREALDKDLPLIEAALATDSIILSRDGKARGLFRQAARKVGKLRQVLWIDPVEDDGWMTWLAGEGEMASDRFLGGKEEIP